MDNASGATETRSQQMMAEFWERPRPSPGAALSAWGARIHNWHGHGGSAYPVNPNQPGRQTTPDGRCSEYTGILACHWLDRNRGCSGGSVKRYSTTFRRLTNRAWSTIYLPSRRKTRACLFPNAATISLRLAHAGAGTTPQWESHRYFCEFWVKYRGNDSELVGGCAPVFDEVPARLMADQTLGGTVETIGWTEDGDLIDVRVRTNVDNELLLVGDARYLRVTVEVPVIVTL